MKWKEHVYTTLVLSGLIAVFHMTGDSKFRMLFATSAVLSEFLFSPDLDTNSKSYYNWGPLRILWWPYKSVFKHRGISHDIIIGPIIRALYISIIVYAILFVIKYNVDILYLKQLVIDNFEYLKHIILGVWFASFVHVLLDRF